ncbi:MAG: hypothetical protein Q8M02_07585 [Candidatus Didemnitutus sp.]|nr:hypothetical protein [Candidatus Didemnitutus sp.]
MNFRQLIRNREELLRQAHLANVAFAYQRLSEFARRIARAQLSGRVQLQGVDPERERFAPLLVAEHIAPSVIEEHFLEGDIAALADMLAFLQEGTGEAVVTFRLEEIAQRLLPALRAELALAGVEPGPEARRPRPTGRDRG